MNKKFIIASTVIVLVFSKNVWAKPPKHDGPPPEAIEACEGKNEGERVSFETPHGHTLNGFCKTIENRLAAVPEHHRKMRNEDPQ